MILQKFNANSIRKADNNYFFAEDVLELHPAIFTHCRNNLAVEDDLINAGVLDKKGASGGLLRIEFVDEESALLFVERLNAYLHRMNDFLD